MFSVSQAAIRLGVCPKTIRRWDAAGRLHCLRTPGGHRRITPSELDRLLAITRGVSPSTAERRCVVYARVSSHRQRNAGDLQRQVQRLVSECIRRFKSQSIIVIDVGSGLRTLTRRWRRGEESTSIVQHVTIISMPM